MKKCFTLLLTIALLCTFPTAGFSETKTNSNENEAISEAVTTTSNPNIPTEAEAAVLMIQNTGEIVFEKNGEQPLPPASLTKIMTLLLVNEDINKGKLKLTDKVTVSKKAWQTGGSKMFIEVDTQVSVDELIKGVAIVSGNDAAVALAEHIAGSTDAFIERMNARAQELGLANTHFTSVNGLSDKDVTTAIDFAKLAKAYIDLVPDMLKIHSTQEYEYNKIPQLNRNPFLTRFEGADGLKTGFVLTNFNIVVTAKRDGLRFISVSLNSKTEGQRYRTNKALLEYGFANYSLVQAAKKGTIVQEVRAYKVKGTKKVNLVLKEDVNFIIKKGDKTTPEVVSDIPKHIRGAKKAGEVVGKQTVTLGSQTAVVDVVVEKELKKANLFKRTIDHMKLWFA